MAKTTWVDKTDADTTATLTEDPTKTPDVHIWIFKHGKVFNHCIVPSRWVLDNFQPAAS